MTRWSSAPPRSWGWCGWALIYVVPPRLHDVLAVAIVAAVLGPHMAAENRVYRSSGVDAPDGAP
jgi:hypothetical protein